jgi:hypothetical protein
VRVARSAYESGLTLRCRSGVDMYAVSKLAREERELRDVLPERAAETADGKTSPEELIAAAHTECLAMQFSALLGSRAQRQIAGRPTAGDPRGTTPHQRPAPWRHPGDRGYWTQANDPEIDLVGADREPVAQRISFVGSIKWRDHHPFDERDLAELIAHRSKMPGADEPTPLLAVARSAVAVDSLRAFGP